MNHWLFGALLAFFLGIGISFLNYRISVYMLNKNPALIQASTLTRQVLHIGYLVAIYFLAPYTPWDRISMLVAAVIGVTGSLFVFTGLLVRRMDQKKRAAKDTEGTDSTDTRSH